MSMREELSARVKAYNNNVKSVIARVNEANAKVEYSKKEFERGCEALSKELGREVNADNLESICAEIENQIKEQVTLGEQLIERANTQLNGANSNSLSAPAENSVVNTVPQQVATPPQAVMPQQSAVPQQNVVPQQNMVYANAVPNAQQNVLYPTMGGVPYPVQPVGGQSVVIGQPGYDNGATTEYVPNNVIGGLESFGTNMQI